MRSNEIIIFKCALCDFSSSSEKGLKTHVKRKNTKSISEKGIQPVPKTCDLCEKQFNSEKEMKKCMKTHSYKQVEFRCEECDFLGETPFTMEVHLGKSHSDHFEFGLCEFVATDLEKLEMHLFTL